MRAQHALVDPVLTHGLPPKITAYAGIDALAQAIAAMVVTVRTPISDGIALESIRLAGEALPKVVADGADAGAPFTVDVLESDRRPLHEASRDYGSEHSLRTAIGGMLGLPHGLTIGLVLAETMDRDRLHVPDQFERIADALGELDDGRQRSRAVTAVRRNLNQLEFETLAAVEVTESRLDELAEKALADFFISVAPAPWTERGACGVSEGMEIGDRR